ncbi:hypothetical protein EVJ32_09535 [Exiguobacterium sp. SH5S4]|uniref:hypothetical protein n=1 Tax=Exiguobacterium sp. SH5S4 TaxID=2510961 RepID=UPI00103A8451|nr:hypothetical protein [Exiguobacterium sp. SH5S4]TCI25556.1 hypothetical protein EVJ32_09535 [Exiguobacterium sp. SH5S4]
MYEVINITPHPRRSNHVLIHYKGQVVAEGLECPSGRIEVRPDAKRFSPLHRTHKVLDMRQIEELVLLSDECSKR